MSDSSPLLILLTLLILLAGLGFGGTALYNQLAANNIAAIAAAVSRPPGLDEGPGEEIFVLDTPTKPSEVSMWLRVFLASFDSILDAISSRLDSELEKKQKAFDEEENRRRLNNQHEDSAKKAANDADTQRTSYEDNPKAHADMEKTPEARINDAVANEDAKRISVIEDNSRARVDIDGDPESRVRNIAAAEDTGRLSFDNPESRIPVEGDPESRVKNIAAAEDTGRLSFDNPESRIPVDSDPESRVRNIAATEDTERLSFDNPESRIPVEGDPESRVKNIAAAEDTGRLSFDNPESRIPVDSDPESRVRNIAAAEDTGRLSFDNPESRIPVDSDPESRVKNIAAAEDTGRLSFDNPESRIPVDSDPESRVKITADNQDTIRNIAATDNFKAAQGDPESRMRGAAALQDTSRLATMTDDFKVMNEKPEPAIKKASGDADANRIKVRVNETFGFETMSESKIQKLVNKLDTRSEGKINRLKNTFKRPATASLVTIEVVEGRILGSDGRVRPLSENTNAIKYDAKAAGAFGTSPSKECQSTSRGRGLLAGELSSAEISSRGTPRATMIKSAALKSAGIAVDVLGSVGDILDVLQIIQVFGNAGYYDPTCTTNPSGCKFPTEFLTANQAKDVSALAIKKQIENLTKYTPRDSNFKPRFPLIRGPLDVLNPEDPYINQTLIQLEVDAVQNIILNGDPWRSKYVNYFGTTAVVDEIVNDPSDALSYYTDKVGMTNTEIDTVYKQAFTSVCLQNKGKVWEDVYEVSGRPRLQCGFTKADCAIARAKYFTPNSAGNYVEWYKYTDIETLLTSQTPRIAPPIVFTSKPTDEDGICMVASSGTAALCNYYRGTYDVDTHSCIFSPEYCQSIGTCWNQVNNTCYLPNNEMEALSFFFPGGGVREWIKINGCTFVGTKDEQAAYAAQSLAMTFMPITMLFTPNGRRMLQDVIANSRNWGPGLKSQLSDPMTAVSFAGAVVGLSTAVGVASATAMGFAASGVGMPVAVAIIAAVGITMAVTEIEGQLEKNQDAKVDKEDTALYGLQKVSTSYIPTSTGVSEGWVTRKLVTTKKADNTLCTAVENYKNPTVCKPVVWTAENPHVVEIPFVSRKQREVVASSSAGQTTSWLLGGGQAGAAVSEAMQYAEDPVYSHKLQCWKKEYTLENTEGGRSGVTGVLVGAATNYGDANGTPDAATGKIFDGYIRAGTDGSVNKTWCLERKPREVLFDATIGTPAPETQNLRNRSWTSKFGDVDQYYPEYPREASYLSARDNDHFRYQLVYARDSIPTTTMWDDGLMDAVFAEATVSEIRRYYCEQELIKYSSDTSMIDKRCFGYLNLNIAGYLWFAMSLPGNLQSAFNTKTGKVTTGTLTRDNKDTVCEKNHGPNFEEESKGLCYLNCNYGSGATNDSYAYVSREWKSDGTIQCLKQYPNWENQSKNLHGELTIVKNIITAQWQGIPNSCSADKEKGLTDALCYPKCSSKFTLGVGEEAISDGATLCYKHYVWWEDEASRKGRPAGTGPRTSSTMNKPLAFGAVRKGLKSEGVCPTGYENVGGICYTKCNSDQTGVGPTCFNNNCPAGTTEPTKGMCRDDCKTGYFWDQSACYKNCNDGFSRSSLGFCMGNCTNRTHASKHNPSDIVNVEYVNNGAGVCRARDNFSCPSSYDRWGVGTSTPTCFRPYKSETKGSDYVVIGQVCASVCRCDSANGWSSTGATCFKAGSWYKGCSSYICC